MPISSETATTTRIVVDPIRCTGHGVCAGLLAGIETDEWGYPVVHDARVAPAEGRRAVQWCPARALRLASDPAAATR